MIMQTAFFLISGILTQEQAIAAIKKAIYKTYGNKGDKVVQMNYGAVDAAVKNITEVPLGDKVDGKAIPSVVPEHAPKFVKEVTARIIEGKGTSLKVSQIPNDGTWPTGTTQYEKRNIAVPCRAGFRTTAFSAASAPWSVPMPPTGSRSSRCRPTRPKALSIKEAVGKGFKGKGFALQIFTEDCCGCTLCVSVCPAKVKALEMIPNSEEVRVQEERRLFPQPAGDRSGRGQPDHGQGQPADATAVRVLRRLRRLRRDPLYQADHPDVRRPDV
jgi:pyruvate-ferredoxin/flavodoxin oxidoreductase